MFPELHIIERICRRPTGSLRSVAVVDPDDLATQPNWRLSPVIGTLDFKSGKSAYLIEDDRLRGRLEDSTTVSAPAGDYFDYTLTFSSRKVRAVVELLRAKLRNRRVHVVVTEWDGTQRFLPYMRLSAKSDTSDRPGGRNGYQFTGTCRLIQPAPYIDVTIEIPTSVQTTFTHSDTTDQATWSYAIPAGRLLVAVFVMSDAPQTVLLGTSAGGEQLGGPIELEADQYALFGDNNLRTLTTTTIYLSGLEGNNAIEVWTLKKTD